MTRGSKRLTSDRSFHEWRPILLLDRFDWTTERRVIADLFRRILRAPEPNWRVSGAYLFWAQPKVGDGSGFVLYTGESVDLADRQSQHLLGYGEGNKHRELSEVFGNEAPLCCGLAVLALPPRFLPGHIDPDGKHIVEDDESKRSAEMLEALLLRAAISVAGRTPPLNCRGDASPHRHGDDVLRYRQLVRFLLEHDEASQDLVTFVLRVEEEAATRKLILEGTQTAMDK